MNTLLSFLKKIPWWGYVAAFVFVILVWQQMSGWAMSRKFYDMVLDQLRVDQSNIIQAKDEWIKTCEDEISKLQAEKEHIQIEKVAAQQQAIQSAGEVARLKGENNALHTQLQNVVVPDDPNRIIDDLRKRFPSIHKARP